MFASVAYIRVGKAVGVSGQIASAFRAGDIVFHKKLGFDSSRSLTLCLILHDWHLAVNKPSAASRR